MKLGCGLFGLAMELGEDFWGTMQKLADIGFTAVEPLYAFKEDTALQPGSPVPSFLKTILWNEEEVKEYLPRLNLMEHGLMIDQDQPAKGKVLSEDLKRGAEYLLRRELCSVPHGGRRCRECHVFTDVRRKEE